MVWIMIMISLIALVFLFLFIMAIFNEKSDVVVNTCFTGLIVFVIALIVMPCLYIKQENEWKDTIQQRLEEKHYLLPEKVNEKFRPIIEIEDWPKKKAIPFSVTFIFNGADSSKREKFPGLYLKGTLRGTEVKNIQIANENYLNKQKQFKKLADNTIDLYQVDFLYSGELSGITTDNQKVRVNQDGTELFVNDKKIEGEVHK